MCNVEEDSGIGARTAEHSSKQTQMALAQRSLYAPNPTHRTEHPGTDLVEHNKRPQAVAQRLLHNKLGLRQRALIRIHQQHRAIHHAQDPSKGKNSPEHTMVTLRDVITVG